MKKLSQLMTLLLAMGTLLFVSSCDDDDSDTPKNKQLELDISGLGNLGTDYAYEGWLIVDGAPVSTGTFTVNDDGELSETMFDVDDADLDSATAFVLTIEPSPDIDPAPSNTHLLAGDISGNSADLSISHEAAIGEDFADADGEYILATPTNGPDSDENSGLWFLDPDAGPAASLVLPELPDGWTYEGWAVIDDMPVTTGKFTAVDEADQSAPYSSDEMAAPMFPGEDFLMNAPGDLTFPTDLAGGRVVVSVEPDPDNSPDPFMIKPLAADIPSDAMDHTTYEMDQNMDSFPSGSISITND